MALLLIDGNNLAAVANFAGSALSTRDGFPTRAIVGFLDCARSYIEKFAPEKMFVAWDGGKSKKRLEALPAYKECREMDKKTPQQAMNFQELFIQIPIIRQVVMNLGIGTLNGPGIEADDLLALMALQAEKMGKEVVIVSSDSDFHQLVSEKISIYSPLNSKKKHRLVTLENFGEIHDGLVPGQYLDYKALLGDKSDDVPGVSGIGPVAAKKLLMEYGNIENILNVAEDSLTKPAAKVLHQWHQYQLSKALINLRDPLAEFTSAAIICPKPDFPMARATAQKYEILSIYGDFGSWVRPFKRLATQ